ncbi:MAG: hypothetical protein JSS65_01585 [Armatimonadetes bacterium]|nr:hypothetical protein [Armatimonadota bacterium]
MRSVICFSVAIVAVALTGCNNPKKLSNNPEPAKAPSPDVPAPLTKNDRPPEAKVDPRDFVVKSGPEQGYGTSTMAPKSLGAKTDEGIAALHEANGVARVLFDGPRGKLNGESYIKVQDAKTFMVEYLLVQTDAAVNKIIADGHRKRVYENRKWEDPAPASGSGPMKPQEIDAWIARSAAEMFAGLRSGEPVWDRLLSGLNNDPGRTTIVEQQMTTVKSIKRPIYRVVSRKKDSKTDVLEIVIDGKRWLPLTVKANYIDTNGAEVHTFWTARWAFGAKFEDKDFLIADKTP